MRAAVIAVDLPRPDWCLGQGMGERAAKAAHKILTDQLVDKMCCLLRLVETRCSARWSICENFQYSPSETLKKRPRACQPHRRSPVHRLRARHAAAAPHSHLSKVYSHLKTAEWRLTRRPSARRARAERACPSQLPLALPAARGPQGRCVGHCCCATPLVLVDTRASRAAFAAVPKKCSARRDTARWSGIRAAMPLSLRESTRATSRTRHAIGRQRRSRR